MNELTIIERTPAQQFWYRVWGQRVIARTIFSKRFWNESFEEYPQTWYYMPHKGVMKKVLQGLCWLICRHELSKTEWGYGGGDKVDNWCRWCNKRIQTSIEESRFRHKLFNEMRPDKNMTYGEDVT